MLPEGTVQALATKLEEGQVLLSHSPAEVVAVEGSGGNVWAGARARQRPSQLDPGSGRARGTPCWVGGTCVRAGRGSGWAKGASRPGPAPLLLPQVLSHFGLAETLQAVEAGGQVQGQLVGPDAVGQLVCSLQPRALLCGRHLGRGALRKPGKSVSVLSLSFGWYKWVRGPVVEGPSEYLTSIPNLQLQLPPPGLDRERCLAQARVEG